MSRSKLALRSAGPLRMAAGALMLILPSGAAALGVNGSAPQLRAAGQVVAFGRPLALSGVLPGVAAGSPLAVALQPEGATRFETVAHGRAGVGGRFALRVRLRKSGVLRVLAAVAAPAPGFTGDYASPPLPVTVDARIRLRRRALELEGSAHPTVRGRLLVARPRRQVVVLQVLRHGRWVGLARGRTSANGRFALRVPQWARSGELRVRFAGDRLNGPARVRAGRLLALRAALASWYEDAGQTACGFHATYGVANVSLACGTRVTFSYHGRTVTAVVDDRGPYVAGRTWDLDQNTAAALSFSGVATVYYLVH
jgi:rare lipoprotein A